MSLSVLRPILIEPGGASAGRPGRRIFSMLVARLPSLERGAAAGPIAVTDSSAGWERAGWLARCDAGRVGLRAGARRWLRPRLLGGPAPAGTRDRDRRGRRPANGPFVPAHLETQLGAVRIADVDALAVLDVDGRHPASVHVHAVEAAVVDRDPPALVEPQHQVCPGDQGVGDAYVGAQVATDDDIISRGEVAG